MFWRRVRRRKPTQSYIPTQKKQNKKRSGSVSRTGLGEPQKTHISRERMKKRSILIKLKITIQLMFPDNASSTIDIDEFEERGVSRVLFLYEDEGTFEAGVGPSVWVGVSVKDASGSGAVDFVRVFGEDGFDF